MEAEGCMLLLLKAKQPHAESSILSEQSLHQCHGCTHRATPCYWSPSFRDDFEHACLLSKDVPTEVRFGHLVKILL